MEKRDDKLPNGEDRLRIGKIPPPYVGERDKYLDDLKTARPEIALEIDAILGLMNDPNPVSKALVETKVDLLNKNEKESYRLKGRPPVPIEIQCRMGKVIFTPYQQRDAFQIQIVWP